MKTPQTLLLTALLPLCSFGQISDPTPPSERTEVIIDPDGDDKVVFHRYIEDTIPSITRPWRDPAFEARIGLGLHMLNGLNSGGISGSVEVSKQITRDFNADISVTGVFGQGDSHPVSGELMTPDYAIDSWMADVGGSMVISDRIRKKVHMVNWKYDTHLGVRYEEHAPTWKQVRHRHLLRAGWNQFGGHPLGFTSPSADSSAQQIVVWNRTHLGNLTLGYAYRMDRILEVLPTEHFSGKNLSRSRVIYADLLLNLQKGISGDLMESDGNSYRRISSVTEDQLIFSPVGVRMGYRGTYMMKKEAWGFFHKYEMGWRPSYTYSSTELSNVHSMSGFYLSLTAGIQF